VSRSIWPACPRMTSAWKVSSGTSGPEISCCRTGSSSEISDSGAGEGAGEKATHKEKKRPHLAENACAQVVRRLLVRDAHADDDERGEQPCRGVRVEGRGVQERKGRGEAGPVPLERRRKGVAGKGCRVGELGDGLSDKSISFVRVKRRESGTHKEEGEQP